MGPCWECKYRSMTMLYPCTDCVFNNSNNTENHFEPYMTDPEKAIKLKEIFNILYGDIFPEVSKIEMTSDPNTIYVIFNERWKGTFTFNNPRDYKLTF